MTDNNIDPFWGADDNETEVVVTNAAGGVSQVTASVTISAKPLGGDAFIKLEEVFQFTEPVDAGTALIQRSQMLEVLREQAIEEATLTANAIRAAVAATPRGNVSVHPVQQAPVNTGTQFGQSVSTDGPAATVAVANGATPVSSGQQWASVKAKFGDGELRFITTASYPSEKLKDDVANEMLKKFNINPQALVVWDNRVGPKGLEAGVPAGCVAAVKIAQEARDFVAAELHAVAVARVKQNADGSLYVWMTKEGEAALKYGALDRIKVGG